MNQTVDGVEPHRRRRALAVLFQDFVRYPASLRDNVTSAVPDQPGGDAAVREALRLAGDAGLPEDLDTLLWREGTGGTDLSGGQWQRVALGRVLYAVAAGRRLLVLDEPTASLDVWAEPDFHERVVSQVHNATTVLISYRLSTVRPAQRIVLLRDGRVAEDGTHDELITLGGEYARFFTAQAAAFTGPSEETVMDWLRLLGHITRLTRRTGHRPATTLLVLTLGQTGAIAAIGLSQRRLVDASATDRIAVPTRAETRRRTHERPSSNLPSTMDSRRP